MLRWWWAGVLVGGLPAFATVCANENARARAQGAAGVMMVFFCVGGLVDGGANVCCLINN